MYGTQLGLQNNLSVFNIGCNCRNLITSTITSKILHKFITITMGVLKTEILKKYNSWQVLNSNNII